MTPLWLSSSIYVDEINTEPKRVYKIQGWWKGSRASSSSSISSWRSRRFIQAGERSHDPKLQEVVCTIGRRTEDWQSQALAGQPGILAGEGHKSTKNSHQMFVALANNVWGLFPHCNTIQLLVRVRSSKQIEENMMSLTRMQRDIDTPRHKLVSFNCVNTILF